MTIEDRELRENEAPRYLAIADGIARDVAAGVLKPGTRLPTHRALAHRLGVSIGTVTRGYAEAERRGLIQGEVGRGTFVRRAGGDVWGVESAAAGVVDLSLALPWSLPEGEETRLLSATLASIVGAGVGADLLEYAASSAHARHRRQAAQWLEGLGVPARESSVVVTAGAQHALTVVFMTLIRPGEVVAVEELTYPGVKAIAHVLGVRLRGVALDGEGMEPAALDRACRDGPVRAVYCVPTGQNPTGARMSEARRRALVDVARAHDLLIVEDDVHGMLTGAASAPLAAHGPERTVHIVTFSKSLAFGLRTAFATVPAPWVDAVRAGVRGTIWMAPPLMAEVTLRWLSDGTAETLMRRKGAEVAARQALVDEVLGDRCEVRALSGSLHAWLCLPEPWRSDELVAQLRQRSVIVAGAEAFLVGRGAVPHAVRIGVGTPRTRAELERALRVIADVLASGAAPVASIV
jgi:DNA-binding transcriptional MocR family regulator